VTDPNADDEREARALARRIAGPAGADRLLAEARVQVAAICAEPGFRSEVESLARELLRRRTLNAADVAALRGT
jgi:hypothetical protein